MNDIFLIDRNIISFDNLIQYINENKIQFDLSEIEEFILNDIKKLSNKNIKNFDDLIQKIKTNNFSIVLKTSGTTGKPKEIKHTISSITKNIKIDPKYELSTWGLTYPIGKMAFYQVIFQSLFNKSRLINLFGYDFDTISDRIIENKITNISATPTFYKILLSNHKKFNNIKQVTLGGERVDENLIKNLKNNFPNASIKNIYASTETASLFASSGETFKIPEKYKNKIKIENNLLYIHKDLLGDTEKVNTDEYWFNTQDIVEFINDNEFKFIGRENIEINVSGFKINPFKVESLINSLDYVKNSVVFSKKNSVIGNVLCCDIVINKPISKTQIKNDLKLILDKYEIPSIINIVDSLPINGSMKISRT